MAQRPDKFAEAKARDEAERAERQRQRADLDRARTEAAPVHVVKLSVPFETVFVIVFQVLIAQLIIVGIAAAAVLAALYFFGVL